MPGTITELYESASEAMLARGGIASPEVRRLIKRTFLEAHAAQRREIEDRMLDVAALSIASPGMLAGAREKALPIFVERCKDTLFTRISIDNGWGSYSPCASKGDVVLIRNGKDMGKLGVVTQVHEHHSYSGDLGECSAH